MADILGVAVRFGLYLSLMLAFGLPAYALLAPRHPDTSDPGGPCGMMLGIAIAGILLSLAQLATLAASMAGIAVAAVDRVIIGDVLSAGAIGIAWKTRMAALFGLVAFTALPRWTRRRRLAGRAVLGGIATATLAWFGHGAMDEGVLGWCHLGADILHLLAAGLWAGALTSLVSKLWRRQMDGDSDYRAERQRELASFGRTGTAIVILLILTGVVNAWLLIGPRNVAALPATAYGRLLITKLLLFGAMLILAALNRFHLTPRLADRSEMRHVIVPTIRRLRASLLIETGCIVAVFAVVAFLGSLPPTGMS